MSTLTGSQIPFVVSLTLPGDLTMDDITFDVSFWIYANKAQMFSKADMTRIDANNYQVTVDTAPLGRGRVNCTVTSYIHDPTLGIDATRKEITSYDNIMEVK